MTKKMVFWVSLAGFITGLILLSDNVYIYCYRDGHCWQLWNIIDSIGYYFYFFPCILFLSIVTYFLREEVFRTWLHFAYFWIPVSIFFVYLAAGSSGGGFGIPNVFDQQTVSFIFSLLFLAISLVLILLKSFVFKKGK